jgi:uncharacterized surface protein with fasciclin (FAS1) repeats
MSFSLDDVVAAAITGSGYEVIGSLLSDNLAGIVADLKVADPTTFDGAYTSGTGVFTHGVLPHDDIVTGASADNDTVRYLLSRVKAQKSTLIQHLAYSGNPYSVAGSTLTINGDFGTAVQNAQQGWTFGVEEINAGTPFEVNSVNVVPYGQRTGMTPTDDGSSLWVTDFPSAYFPDLLLGDLPNPGTSNLATLFTLIGAHGGFAGLGTDVPSEGHYTIFAPNDDDAFSLANIPQNLQDFLVWNKPVTQLVLSNHIIQKLANPAFSETIPACNAMVTPNPCVFAPLGGMELTVDVSNLDVEVADGAFATANIIEANLYFKNAVVHKVDRVLLNNDQLAIVTDAVGLAALSEATDATTHATLQSLIPLADDAIATALGATTQQTLFAPTEAAFNKLLPVQKAFLTDSANKATLDKILKAHVLDSAYYATGVNPVAVAARADLDGNTLSCTGLLCTAGFNDAVVGLSNQRYTKYGVVYDIDTVIIPAGVVLPSSASAVGVSAAVAILGAVVAMLV